ncbi:hypothetical protein [Paenibacillus sp. V4I5]|uniref:hypothetical protein n=1 Tax=Paenibacillus sp. V4I5 TaxID=3042306 RepID=UPI00278FD1F0|nr:hypothetical protein [Paenibacillus sp. V4I5]MDQ0913881.1 hypothetical protein [Paenibacillus sp. V4I5]
MSMNFHSNGFIVKSIDNNQETYLGVDGDCWNIDEDTEGLEKQDRDYIKKYISQTIATSWLDEQAIDACCDLSFVNKYIKACINAKIDFQVLFCKTNRTKPSYLWNINEDTPENFRFIGFDYAYPGGSFYSCVFSDLYTKRIPELSFVGLNEHGLIPSEELLKQFIERRNELIEKDRVGRFEQGAFATYKLWQYTGEYPINLNY